MNTLFPFGFPMSTQIYLLLYVLTLVSHVLFMNYVLAGTGYITFQALFGQQPSYPDPKLKFRSPAMILRDWLPFALGLAITAGVAPLLFVQILYRHSFYTANLLLFHRWMAILPVLIVGFYLLYIIKSKQIRMWPMFIRLLTCVIAFACFAFVAYSWTENHLLSLHSENWVAHWQSTREFYFEPAILPRLGMWFIGAIPTMVVLLSWQLWGYQWREFEIPAGSARLLALLAMIGLVLAGLCAIAYYQLSDDRMRQAVFSTPALPYAVAAVIGVVLQLFVWFRQWCDDRLRKGLLILAAVGSGFAITGMTVVREMIRINTVDFEALYAQHARSAEVGGLFIFLFFFIVNLGVVVYCIRAVVKNQSLTRIVE